MANNMSGRTASGRRKKGFSVTNRRRLFGLFCFMMICFGILIGRLAQLNVTKGAEYKKNVMQIQSSDSSELAAKRGDITDRNGTVLATSEAYYDLILDCKVVNTSTKENARENTISVLGELFGIDAGVIEDKLDNDPDNSYVKLAEDLTYDQKKQYDDLVNSEDEEDQVVVASIENCFWFEEDYKRVYPYSTLACDVIGFMKGTDDDKYYYGLEEYYDDALSGTNGKTYGYITENVDLDMVTKEAQNGKTVVTTIDANIQRIAEKYIDEFMTETGAQNVAAIVMDPNNGEILAMASAPVFDCNDPDDTSVMDVSAYEEYADTDSLSDEDIANIRYMVWNNFCVQDSFEPGSTAKCMTVSYAMDQGLVKDSDTFVCDGGETYSDGTSVSCNSYHGTLTLQESLAQSCNDAMMQISDLIGHDGWLKLQKLFGIGEATGIDLPSEVSCEGLVYDDETLGPVELWTSSFGQGYNVNMVQIAASFCSIVNGGSYYQPHIVSSIQTDTGTTVEDFDKKLVRTTVSQETSDWMKEALYQTVENGTGHYAQVSGYKIGGKTGTAPKNKRDSDERLVSFIGAAPIDDPQLVVYVVVDEPVAEDQGQSSFASIIAGKIFAEALPYLQIFPTEEADDSRITYDPNAEETEETVEEGTQDDGTVIEDDQQDDQKEEDIEAGDAADGEEDVSDGEEDAGQDENTDQEDGEDTGEASDEEADQAAD